MPRTVPFRLRIADELPATADLVIVGAGVVGCATAFYAARAGLRTVVLDARPRPATLTTAAATGSFRLQFDNADELALVREGVELFDAIAERTGLPGYDIGLVHRGYLFCARTQDSAERQHRMVERQRAMGLDDVEILPGDEARRRFPYLAGSVLQARFRGGDGSIDQVRLALGYAFAASGCEGVDVPVGTVSATFAFGTRATGLRMAGDRVVAVETAGGGIAASQVVLATGPFLARTAALVGVDLDIRPTRRQKLVMPEVPEVPPDAPMTIDEETAAHWRPAHRGALLVWTEGDTPASEPSWNVPTSADFAFRLLDPSSDEAVAHVAPFWTAAWERGDGWLLQAGQYEYTPDRRPYIGPVGPDGLFVNGGYSGHGVMGSAGGARRLVDELLGTAADNPFRPERPMAVRELDIL
jgi:sarcosine oxidase subunit beta